MTALAVSGRGAPAHPAGSTARLAWHQFHYDLRAFFRNRQARFFTLGPAGAVPGHLRLGVHRHHQGRGRVDRHLGLLRPRHHHAGDHQRRIRQSRSASWTPTSTHLRWCDAYEDAVSPSAEPLGRFCPDRHAHSGPCCGGSSVQLTRKRPEWSFLCRPGDQRPDGSCDRVGRVDPLRQGAGGWFGRLRRMLAVPAHLGPAPRADRRAVRVQRQLERDWLSLRPRVPRSQGGG